MGSKGRIPPPYMRRHPPGPGMVHPDPFGPGMHPPSSGLPFDMLPQVLEQKIAAQDVEMERLITENRRFAATHGTLRQQLAAVEQEKQSIEARVGAMKSEREREMRALKENISKMEAELKTADSVKAELQKARSEAQGLVASRQELISKAQQLNQDLQKVHAELPQIPALMSQLDTLRQEYQHCRAVYESEKKFYSDHLETLQSMEKNYNTMALEVEKLRAELNNTAGADRRAGSAYAGAVGYGANTASAHHSMGKNAYEDGYPGPQGNVNPPVSGGAPAYGGLQPNQVQSRPGYDFQRGPTSYDPQKAPYYGIQGGSGYNAQAQRYDLQMGASYGMQRPPYDPQRAAPSVGPPQSQVPYGSASVTPPARPPAGYEAQPRGANTGRR